MSGESDPEGNDKAGFYGDDYKLAVEMYTEAMAAGTATADLYAHRARALIMLGDYTGARVIPLSLSLSLPIRLSLSCSTITCFCNLGAFH
jgi:hypothetical protein